MDGDSPEQAKVFLIGYNQSTPYLADKLSHGDALRSFFEPDQMGFYRTQRKLAYPEKSGDSRTRLNENALAALIRSSCGELVLQTNVICYSTRNAKEARSPQHRAGTDRGRQLFKEVLHQVCPRAIIIHGVRTIEEFNIIASPVPGVPPPPRDAKIIHRDHHVSGHQVRIYPVPSFSRNWWQQFGWTMDRQGREIAEDIATLLCA